MKNVVGGFPGQHPIQDTTAVFRVDALEPCLWLVGEIPFGSPQHPENL